MNVKIINRLALFLFSILTFTILQTGCTVNWSTDHPGTLNVKTYDLLTTPAQPPPPPVYLPPADSVSSLATWNSSPDFAASSITKIAIITESGGGNFWGSQNSDDALEDVFIESAFQKGYRVSDRSDVNKILQEIHFQQSGLTENDAAQLGRMLNVQAVLIVKVTDSGVDEQRIFYPGSYVPQYTNKAWATVSARLIGVQSAEVLGVSIYTAKAPTDGPRNATPAITAAADQIAATLPNKN